MYVDDDRLVISLVNLAMRVPTKPIVRKLACVKRLHANSTV